MSGLEVAFVVLAGVYTGAIAWLYTGVVRGGKSAPTGSGVPSVSIIVSARDEAETIADCLAALKAQESGSPIEVVVVDDRSTDRTADIVRETSSLWPHLSLVPASAELRFRCPKKSALAQGIEASSGEILLFTDADCCPPPDWVRETVARFGEDVGMVAGYARAPILRKSLKQSLLALDNLAIGALSAGGIGMGAPLACTGRNLAYRRQVYDQVGGFSSIGHLVGGDDVYLTRLVSSKTNWKTVYNTSEKSIVECKPRVADAAATANQKLRHASKASHYRGPARLLGVAAYAFHALLLVGILQLIAAGLEVTGLGRGRRSHLGRSLTQRFRSRRPARCRGCRHEDGIGSGAPMAIPSRPQREIPAGVPSASRDCLYSVRPAVRPPRRIRLVSVEGRWARRTEAAT